MKWLPVLALGLSACASAEREAPADGSPGADGAPPADAVPIDAPPPQVTLSQNTSTTVTGGSFACSLNNITLENSYYRVFALADHGITGGFQVQMVTFGIQTAAAGGTQIAQAAQVKLGRYMGSAGGTTLDLAQVMPISSAAIMIPNRGPSSIDVPITGTIPGGDLIVELVIPDGRAALNTFFVGTNAAGESKPGYVRSPACNVVAPTGMNALGMQHSPPLPKADLIMTVRGLRL
ncbi:MAG TPA: hypothetical protein VN253_21715 [Kofleriaceae bacterium]|nr:hypothetical protein [Kofleriaceae bacterium]